MSQDNSPPHKSPFKILKKFLFNSQFFLKRLHSTNLPDILIISRNLQNTNIPHSTRFHLNLCSHFLLKISFLLKIFFINRFHNHLLPNPPFRNFQIYLKHLEFPPDFIFNFKSKSLFQGLFIVSFFPSRNFISLTISPTKPSYSFTTDLVYIFINRSINI